MMPTSAAWITTDSSPSFVVGYQSQQLSIFDASTGLEKSTLSFNPDPHKSLLQQQINKLEVSEQHNLAISGHEDNSIKFYDLGSGKCINSIIGHTDSVSALQATPSKLVSGGHDGSIRAWDMRTFTRIFDQAAHRKKYDEGVQCLAYNELF